MQICMSKHTRRKKGCATLAINAKRKMYRTVSVLKINTLERRQVRHYDIFVANFEQKFQYYC